MAKSLLAFREWVTFTCSSPRLVPSGQSVLAEQNLVRFSQAFGGSYWFKSDVTTNGDSAIAPDGTMTADEIIETTSNTFHGIRAASANAIPIVAGKTYAVSVFLQKGDGASAPDWIQLTMRGTGFAGNEYANFDLTNVVVGTSVGAGAPVISERNGFYRCTIFVTATATASSETGPFIAFTNNNDGLGRLPNYIGSTDANVFVWGAQVEERTFVTDYLPTTDQPVTRYQPNTLKQVVVDEPRFQYRPDSKARRVIVESSRKQLLTWSNDFSNPVWTKNNSFVLLGFPGPFDDVVAFKLIPTSVNNLHQLAQTTPETAANAVRVLTAIVRRDAYDFVQLIQAETGTGNNASRIFNLVTDSVVAIQNGDFANIGYGIKDLGNGWVELYAAMQSGAMASGAININVRVRDDSVNATFTGNDFSGLHVAHSGLYDGSKPPLVPVVSEASQITQAAEKPIIPASAIRDPSQFALRIESELPYVPGAEDPEPVVCRINRDGDDIVLRSTSAGGLVCDVGASSTTVLPAGDFLGAHKVALSVDSVGQALRVHVDGALKADIPHTSPASAIQQIGLGWRPDVPGNYFNGYLSADVLPLLNDAQGRAVTA